MRPFILAVLILFSACSSPAPPASPPSSPKSTVDPARAQNGERVYKKLVEGLKRGEPQLSGFAAPSVRLTVPKSKWEKLSKADQVDVTYYAESLIADVRVNPRRYIDMPPTAPAYENAVTYAEKICGGCWEIMVGSPAKDKVLSVDTVAVQGDTPWESADHCCRGRKGSEFRSTP